MAFPFFSTTEISFRNAPFSIWYSRVRNTGARRVCLVDEKTNRPMGLYMLIAQYLFNRFRSWLRWERAIWGSSVQKKELFQAQRTGQSKKEQMSLELDLQVIVCPFLSCSSLQSYSTRFFWLWRVGRRSKVCTCMCMCELFNVLPLLTCVGHEVYPRPKASRFVPENNH